jgi:hypothetical protein
MFTRAARGEIPEAPSAAELGLPVEIDDILRRATAVKRDERFQSAAELYDALDAALRKTEPASLRELGTTLATAFGKERGQVRQLIEEQFRNMASGRPTEMTNVEVADAHDVDVLLEPMARPSSHAPSTSSALLLERKKAPLALWGAIAATAAVVVAAVGMRVGSHPKGESVTAVASPTAPNGSATATHAEARPEDAVDTNPAAPPRVGVGEGWRNEGSGRHDEGASAGPARPGASTMHRDHGHAKTDATSGSPSGDAEAPVFTPDVVPLRTTTTKPKVRLERDNPWP